MSKKKIYNGKYLTYEDQQSLEETHDMLVKALPGQSYIKEPLNKVSTTQVTGDALMKVAVGGKGGFAAGTAGDVREKKKELSADLVRMEKKEVYKQHLSLEKKVVGWTKELKPIYEKVSRDYDDFMYQGELDASDYMRNAEFYAKTDPTINIELLRELYDETCGYRGAWKYVGLDGAEHRRYRIYVFNTLNLNTKKESKPPHPRVGYMNWEGSSYNHHVVGPNYELYHDMKDGNVRKDCIEYTLMQLSRIKNDTEEWLSHNLYDDSSKYEPSEEFLEKKAIADEYERKRRLEAMLKAPKLDDWKVVYKWELTKQGKVMFANEKI